LVVHLPQPSPGTQNGADDDGQSRLFFVPKSPSHAEHCAVVVSHTGVLPEHCLALVAVQATHWLVLGEQAGVAPLQLESVAHASHLPVFGPVVAHAFERQPDGPTVGQASPLATPHLLSVGSHTPETQARAPRLAVHVPPGTAWPFPVFGWQTPRPASARSSHHCATPPASPVVQTASVEQVWPHAPV
jgi:hypothetical protein